MTTVPFDPKEADALAAEYSEKTGAHVKWHWFDHDGEADELAIGFWRQGGGRHAVRFRWEHLTLAQAFSEAKDAFDAWSLNNPPRSEA